MNTLRTNPNTLLRGGTALALAAAALLGSNACAQPDSRPTPTPHPSETATLAPDVPPRLTCATKVIGQITNRTVKLGVSISASNRAIAYTVNETRYDFGDGRARAVGGVSPTTYTYGEAGIITAEAAIEVGYSPGIGEIPARRDEIVSCTPIGFRVD